MIPTTVSIFLVAIPMCALSILINKYIWENKSTQKRNTNNIFELGSYILSIIPLSISGAVITCSLRTGLFIITVLIFLSGLRMLASFRDRIKNTNIVNREFPLLLDFLVLQIESGHSIMQAFKSASILFPDYSPVYSGLNKFQENLQLGTSVQIALEELANFLGTNSSQTALYTIAQSIIHGSELGAALRNQANRMREHLIIEGEKFANTLSVKLLIPLLFFIFPASFLVIFSPVIVSLTKILQ
jgi:tight adherence protein C